MSEQEKSRPEKQQLREEYPSGFLALMKNDSIPYILDALLDAPQYREFNQSELAREAGVSRQSVNRHIDLLLGVGILEEVENTTPQRYRFNPENRVSKALIELEGAMNVAGTQLEQTVEA